VTADEWAGLAIVGAILAAVAWTVDRIDKDRKREGR